MNDEFRFASYGAETQQQIRQFHETSDPALVVPILRGIVAYYLPKETSLTVDDLLGQPLSALGLDSLTWLEITLDVEDAFGMTFNDQELRELSSFSEIAGLIDRKVKALSDGPR
jgi:acyl carrier protein